MSARKIGLIHISTSSGFYDSFEDAVKDANAIKIRLERLCRQRNYSCIVIIGVSRHNGKLGKVKPSKKKGSRGRPRKVFSGAGTTAPHLHILIVACPCETVRKELQENFNKKAIARGRDYLHNISVT